MPMTTEERQAANISELMSELAKPGLGGDAKRILLTELAAVRADPQRSSKAYEDAATATVGDPNKPKMSYKQAVRETKQIEQFGNSVPMPTSTANPGVTTKGYDTTSVQRQQDLSGNMSDLLTQSLSRTNDLYSELSTVRQQQTTGIQAQGAAATAKIEQSSAEAQQKMADRQAVLEQMGIANPTSADFLRYQEAAGKRAQLADQISTNEAINPLSDPLGYLAGQFKNMWLTQQHNTLTNVANSAIGSLAEKQRVASNTLALQPDLTMAQIAEREKVALQENIAKTEATLTDLRAQGVRDGISANTNTTSIAIQGYKIEKDAITSAKQLQIQRDAQTEGRAKDPLKTALEEAQIQDLQTTAANYTRLTGIPIDWASVATKNKDPRVEVVRQYQTTGYLGQDPVESIQNLDALGGGAKSTDPQVREAGKRAERWKTKAAQIQIMEPDPKQPGKERVKVPKNEKEAELLEKEKLQRAMTQDMDKVMTDASTAGQDNPFVAREGNALLDPALASNIVTIALKDAHKAGLSTGGWSNKSTVELIGAKVASGEIDKKVAASHLAEFYSTTLKNQNNQFGLSLLRTGTPPRYVVTDVLNAPGISLFGEQKKQPSLDLLNVADIEKALTAHMASFIAQKRQQQVLDTMGQAGGASFLQ